MNFIFRLVLLFARICVSLGESGLFHEVMWKSYYRSAASFVSTFHWSHLRDCGFVFVHDGMHEGYALEIESVLVEVSEGPVEFLSGTYVLELSSNVSLSGSRDQHRFIMRPTCSSVILAMHGIFHADLPDQLFHKLMPHWDPLTKKDEDFYFLLGPSRSTESVMMKFSQKVKFKVALKSESNSVGKLQLTTVAPYTVSGSPELITLISSSEWTVDSLFPDMTLNQFGRSMRMSVPNAKWRIEIDCNSDNTKCHPKRGYYKIWLVEAMRKWNFTYDMFLSSLDGGTGIMRNGTWLGTVGDVLYEKAEMGFVIGKILSRHKFVEWSAPLSYEWMIFACHKPRTFFSPTAIFWPFSVLVWTLCLVTLGVVIGVIKVLMMIEGGRLMSSLWPVTRLLGYTYSSLLEQDAGCCNPTNMFYSSVRVFCTFWLIFALIVSNTYKAKLVSVIAFPVSSWVPDTFEELAKSPFQVGLNVIGKGGAAYDLFRSSTSPTFRKMFLKMSIHPDALKCLRQAIKVDICCCMWAGAADYLNQRNMSDKYGRSPFQQSTSSTFFLHDGFIYQKKAIFRRQFDATIRNAIQMGLVDRWFLMDLTEVRNSRLKWERATNQTHTSLHSSNGPETLKIVHLFGALVILCFGIGCSVTRLLYEVYCGRRKSTNELDELTRKN